MATSVLRKLAVQTLRQNVVLSNFRYHQAICKRNFHVSTLFRQKYFSDQHEWIDVPEGSSEGTVGITDYAQDQLGEVVYAQMPEIGQELEKNVEAGALESVKAASDIVSPVSGVVTAVNTDVEKNPGLINSSPNENCWLFKLTIANASELETLMDEARYKEFLTSL